MITGLWMAMVAALLGTLVETAIFWKRRQGLNAKEQCFRFHDLRDRLQLLSIEHKIEQNSPAYRFLLTMINVAIRNAGVIKLSEVLDMSQKVKNADGKEFEKLQGEIGSYSKDVQELASEVFGKFAWMLVVNDDVTYWLFRGLKILTKITNAAVVTCAKAVAAAITPKRAQVVREAYEFDQLRKRLAPSY